MSIVEKAIPEAAERPTTPRYVVLNDRAGRVIDWNRELHITSEMEVFETNDTVPEFIPNLVNWMVEAKTAQIERMANERMAATAAAKAAK